MNNNKHHPFSPSALHALELCPGRYHAEQGLPDLPNSSESIEGKFLHECVALSDINNPYLKDEQKSQVQKCLDEIKKYQIGQSITLNESKIALYDYDKSITITDGTPDCVVVQQGNDNAILFDFKFGYNEVPESANNIQLATYATMVMQHYKVNNVYAIVVQPRINNISEYAYTDFTGIVGYVKNIIAKCKDPDAKRIPSVDACKYCKAQFICPARQQIVDSMVATATTSTENSIAVSQWKDDQLSDFMNLWPLVEKKAKEIKSELERRCKENGKCGTWQAVDGKSDRKWLPGVDVEVIYSRMAEVVQQEFFNKILKIPITELEKLYAQKLKESGSVQTVQEGISQFYKDFNDLFVREPIKKIVKEKQ